MEYLILFYHDEHIVVYDDPCRNVYEPALCIHGSE
jgi:hypothetical protein